MASPNAQQDEDAFWQTNTHHRHEYVSPFANFSSWRTGNSRRTSRTARTPFAEELSPSEIGRLDSDVRGEMQVKPNPATHKQRTSAQHRHNELTEQPSHDFLSWFSVLNTGSDYLTIALLALSEENTVVEMIMFAVGLIAAGFLRAGAVWQYQSEVPACSIFLNILFGSRFGWNEQHDKAVLSRAMMGIQFGFPLIMHQVADIVQHAFTFYPLMVLVLGGSNNELQFFIPFCGFLVLTALSMVITLVVRLSYGALLIELSLLAVFSAQFLVFVQLAYDYTDAIEDEIYTKNLVYPMFRFLSITTAAFTTTAYEVRQKQRIVLPGMLSSIIGVLTLIDAVCIIVVRTTPEVFVGERSLADPLVIVDELIYANAIYDAYVIMFIFVQWRLMLFGQLL